MKSILVLGAGLSSSSLIRYLLKQSEIYDWKIRITDQDIDKVKAKINNHPNGIALNFDALSSSERRPEIEHADLVISMLPANFHVEVAKDCIEFKTNLVTPSYVSPEMKALDEAAKNAGIIIMNEVGVDPGIDHMSAMKIIDSIKDKNGQIDCFKSFCGGLIAPESDDNPWNYKFTWNPRNVVLAGSGGAAKFIRNGQYKYIPYHQLFSRLDYLSVEGYGDFTGYANRDSLSYRSIYGLEDIPTIYRGTLRRPDFCEAWNVFVQLGMTDDSYTLSNMERCSPRDFLNTYLPYHPTQLVEDKFKQFLGEDNMHLYSKFEWLGLFDSDENLEVTSPTPAKLLQVILERKWDLHKNDKDMLVMIHEFEYTLNGRSHTITSSMVNIGEDQVYTSMSNTVGLPVGMSAKLIMNNQISNRGVLLPIKKEIYEPILAELAEYHIEFIEKHS
ncbi:MAG: saccharopine dehydrogenase NADP-binding domain-containing protein [Crocinitomicaceae bacterium]|nr:saccharopine dehydrogenase NADP-binding domain-containing protein [Crocinitomicaceae bacterium]